jgi:hypothetical protein
MRRRSPNCATEGPLQKQLVTRCQWHPFKNLTRRRRALAYSPQLRGYPYYFKAAAVAESVLLMADENYSLRMCSYLFRVSPCTLARWICLSRSHGDCALINRREILGLH